MASNGERDHIGRFAPGYKGGPGRPKGLAHVAKLIAEATNNGTELVDWALKVWRDPNQMHTHRERADAHQWLSERYLGKPLQQSEILALARVEHTTTLPVGWRSMSPADRARFLDELEARGRVHAPMPILDVAIDDE